MAIGGTDADIALALGVSHSTLWRWRSQYPAFLQAYRGEGVQFSTQRAVGYEHQTEKIVVVDGFIHRVPIQPRRVRRPASHIMYPDESY